MRHGAPARVVGRSLLAALLTAVGCDEGPQATAARGTEPLPAKGAGAAGAATASPAGQAGSAPSLDRSCREGIPQVVDGHPSGMAICADGTLARTGPTSCRLADLTIDAECPLGQAPSAAQPHCGKVCADGPHGRPRFGQFEPRCAYFCETSADCPAPTTCACDDDGIGQCVRGPCQTSADCAEGSSCRLTDTTEHCDFTGFRWLECIGPEDACISAVDCVGATTGGPSGEPVATPLCGDPRGTGAKACTNGGPICGRPIVVAQGALAAPLVRGDVWIRSAKGLRGG